jgi:hypothetical protein
VQESCSILHRRHFSRILALSRRWEELLPRSLSLKRRLVPRSVLPTLFKFSRQNGPTIWPLCKNSMFDSISSKYDYIFETMPVPKSVKNLGFLRFTWKKYRKQKIFTRPLLSFAAEESASWEHWPRQSCWASLHVYPVSRGRLLPAGEATSWRRWDRWDGPGYVTQDDFAAAALGCSHRRFSRF